jgi:hypothetical protein
MVGSRLLIPRARRLATLLVMLALAPATTSRT